MNCECEKAKLYTTEMEEIYRTMNGKGLSHVYCQACSGEMELEQAR